MPMTPAKGHVYQIDLQDGKPPHRWLVLCDPDSVGEFIAVSFTDARKYAANPDNWKRGEIFADARKLEKDSVLHIWFARVETAEWLTDHDASFIGICPDAGVVRARCNVLDLYDQLQPEASQFADQLFGDWDKDCVGPD